jgi:hypothetical protein
MSILSKDQARVILQPYHALIWTVIHEAWLEWRSVQSLRITAALPPLLYQRTISNYVFDAIARRAIPLFKHEERVSVSIEAQTFKIFFGGQLLARFKKGGDDKLGNNIPTQAAMAFMEADGILPGMPPETAKVEFIWLPNELWTQIDSILVVARDGDILVWEYEIARPADSVLPLPFPTRPDSHSPDGGDLIKPKELPAVKPKGN